MQVWARWFYQSDAWKKCRLSFMKSKHWLCNRCGGAAKIAHHKTWLNKDNINNPEVTLNWDNLEALCQDCHNKEHNANKEAVQEGLMFDENGDLIQCM